MNKKNVEKELQEIQKEIMIQCKSEPSHCDNSHDAYDDSWLPF